MLRAASRPHACETVALVGRAILGAEGGKVSVQALIDGWNARDGEKVAAAFTPDGVRVEYAKPGARLEGREAIATHVQTNMTAIPDCVLDVHGLIEHNAFGHPGDLPGNSHRRGSRSRADRP